MASTEPIAQVGVEFGTPTGTFQLGDGNVIPNTLQTGDANNLPATFQNGDGNQIPATFGTGGGLAAMPTFTLGDGSNTISATFSTGDPPFATGTSGFITEDPYVPGGTFSTGGGNTIPATFSTGDSPFVTGSPGFSTDAPYVPGGSFPTSDSLPLSAPESVDKPSTLEIDSEEAEEKQPAETTTSQSCLLRIFCF